MEFTEVQELNNLTTHARTLAPKQAVPDFYDTSSTTKGSSKQSTPNYLLDYERVLEDTPPASPSKPITDPPEEVEEILKNDQGQEESPEQIIDFIQNHITQQEANKTLPEFVLDKAPATSDVSEAQARQEEEKPDDDRDFGDQSPDKSDTSNTGFEKIQGNDISRSYFETKNLKSFLSHSIKNFPMSRQDYGGAKRGESRSFRVYCLTERHNTIIPLSLTIPIRELVKICMENFKLNKATNELLKFPDRPDAYDIKKDVYSAPLDKNKTLKEYKVAQELIFLEVPNFDPTSDLRQSQALNRGDKASLLSITLILPSDDRAKLTVQMAPERQIKDLFPRLALEGKTGYTLQTYNIRVYSNDPEARFRDSKNFLDANIPLKSIKTADDIIQLELVKKKFADEPNDVPGDKSISPKKRGETVALPGDQNDQIILYNDVSANHYEEFEVTKINENNKRQTRILGIDGFKLYNYTKSYKHEQAGGIGDMFNTIFFSKFGTMNPERLLSDVVGARVVMANVFKIGVNSEGKEKWTSFEAADARTANQIVAKLNYLRMKRKGTANDS